MTTTFPDTSHHVFPTPPTLQKISPLLNGAQALITKATQGQSMVDESWVPCTQWARITGVPFSGFHWFDTSDITGQVANAFKALGPNIPLMWDAEDEGVTVPRLAQATDLYRARGGKVTLCYLPHWWWHDHMGSADLTPLKNRGLSLVASNYGHGYGADAPGWAAYGNWKPTILQYTNGQSFNGIKVDFNAYPGTVDGLRAVFNGGIVMGSTYPTNSEVVSLILQGRDRYGYVGIPGYNNPNKGDEANGNGVGFTNAAAEGGVAGLLSRLGITLTPEQVTALAADMTADPEFAAAVAAGVEFPDYTPIKP